MNRGYRWFAVLLACALTVPAAYAEKLPVYRLKAPKVDKAKARAVLSRGLAASKSTEKETTAAVTISAGRKVLEIDKRSGHIFMGDMEKLWNPRAKPVLPEAAKARQLADVFLRDNGLLPQAQAAGRVRVTFANVTETAGSTDSPGQLNRQILDRQVNYRTEILVKNAAGADRAIPVYGGGGKHKVSIGDQGSVIGYAGGWREIESVAATEEIITSAAAEAEFRKRAGKAPVKSIKSRLAYYAAPAFEQQSVLAPVWVISAELQVGDETVRAREVVIAATKFGPHFPAGPAAKARSGKEPPPPGNGDEKPQQRGWNNLPRQMLDIFSPAAAYAQNPSECGTSWIGPSQGLGGSPGNKQGFVDQCRAAGWTVNFDWGEAAAFESDWRANDDAWVDNADLVFYTGHASQNGWVLNPPADTFLHNNEANVATVDLWGNTDIEWFIIAACGPHQSTHFTTNTTNAFDRWRGAFDGLHVMLGYGAVTFDNTDEGRRFMELSRAGWNVVDAWFRTAQEIQPATNGFGAPDGPNIFVTAMYAHNGDHCARNDHLWGMGSTCNDVVGAGQQRYLMWSGT
jgi:hypothetical protein